MVKYVCSSCNMDTNDLPEYMHEHKAQPECECIYFRQITSAHVTTNIFHFGGSPASVHGNCRNAL